MINSPFNFDSASRLRISQSSSLSDLKLLGADNAMVWENVGTGSATYVAADNAVNLAVAANTEYEIRRSKQYFPYFAGNPQAIELTFDAFTPQTNVTKRAGYFSSNAVAPYDTDKDGFWLESKDGIVSLVVSKFGTEITRIPQSEWDSKLANYNWDNFTLVHFDFLWLGGGVVRLFVKSGQEFVLATSFHYAGTKAGVMFRSPNQNVRCEIRSTAVGGVGSFRAICARVSTEGSEEASGMNVSISTGSTAISCASIGTTYPIISMGKVASLRNRALSIQAWEALLIAASKQALLTLQINPTLSSPITRTQVAGTCLEFGLGNGTITVTSPGRIIDSKYTASLLGPNATPVLRDFVKNIGMSIADATDIHVICMTPLVATTTVSAYATLRES